MQKLRSFSFTAPGELMYWEATVVTFEENQIRNDHQMLIGLRIRDARLQRHMSPEMLSEKAGVSKAHLCNIEYGRKAPSLEFVIGAARALGISLDYLLLGMERIEKPLPNDIQLHSDDYLLSRAMYTRQRDIPWGGL